MAKRGKRTMEDPATRVTPPDPEAGEQAAPEPAAAEPAAAGASEAALERERWLRRQIDRDRELLVSLGRGLLHALEPESPALRFWRWLIDDLRSERREQAAVLGEPVSNGLLADRGVRLPAVPNPALWILRRWRARRQRPRRRRR